jgi:hypothetical protein
MVDGKKKGVTPDGNALPSLPDDALSKTQSHSASEPRRIQAAGEVPDTVLVELPHGQSEVVRVSVREIRGRMRVDLRIWFRTGDNTWQPSQKGFTANPRQVPELVRGLMLAGQAVDPNGGA